MDDHDVVDHHGSETVNIAGSHRVEPGATSGGDRRKGCIIESTYDDVCLQLHQAGRAKVTLPSLGKFFQVT
jgi:hypothetical protein